MKRYWQQFKEGWMTFWWGEPCGKHPGHRVREFDVELASGCAMMPDMCELCWEEFERQYNP